jgi:hypothetical protein
MSKECEVGGVAEICEIEEGLCEVYIDIFSQMSK